VAKTPRGKLLAACEGMEQMVKAALPDANPAMRMNAVSLSNEYRIAVLMAVFYSVSRNLYTPLRPQVTFFNQCDLLLAAAE